MIKEQLKQNFTELNQALDYLCKLSPDEKRLNNYVIAKFLEEEMSSSTEKCQQIISNIAINLILDYVNGGGILYNVCQKSPEHLEMILKCERTRNKLIDQNSIDGHIAVIASKSYEYFKILNKLYPGWFGKIEDSVRSGIKVANIVKSNWDTFLYIAKHKRKLLTFILNQNNRVELFQHIARSGPQQSELLFDLLQNQMTLRSKCFDLEDVATKRLEEAREDRAYKKSQLIAFAMSRHGRLGKNSPARNLFPDAYILIYSFIQPPKPKLIPL